MSAEMRFARPTIEKKAAIAAVVAIALISVIDARRGGSGVGGDGGSFGGIRISLPKFPLFGGGKSQPSPVPSSPSTLNSNHNLGNGGGGAPYKPNHRPEPYPQPDTSKSNSNYNHGSDKPAWKPMEHKDQPSKFDSDHKPGSVNEGATYRPVPKPSIDENVSSNTFRRPPVDNNNNNNKNNNNNGRPSTPQTTLNATAATTEKPKLETTTHDRSIITAPLKSCPDGQRMGPDRNCRPNFTDPEDEGRRRRRRR